MSILDVTWVVYYQKELTTIYGKNELFVVYGISFTFIEFAVESKAHQFSCSM